MEAETLSALLSAVSEFSKNKLSVGAMERDREGRFDRSVWDQAAALGLAGLPVPEQWGGTGLNAVETMRVVETLGRHCADGGLVFSLCAHMFANAMPLYLSRSSYHHEKYLPRLASGELIAANGTTEPEAGSDIYALTTRAQRSDDGYVLNGTKCFITNAPIADVFLLYATTQPKAGYLGVSAFLIEKGTPGLTVKEEGAKSGLRSSPWGTIVLDDCRVSLETRVGPEGAGASLFHESMIWERGCLFAYYVGAMERALAGAIEHCRSRKQFGRAIGSYQSVSNRIVDMKLRLETSRALLYRAGELHAAGQRCDEAVALSKLWISECAVQSGLDAIQIFGGSGVSTETGVDALLRDAIPSRIFSGTSEMQRLIISKMLGVA